jgi:signal transduction histidine kinase
MDGVEQAAAREIGWNFLSRQAAILVLRVDGAGAILSANSYARELTGLPLVPGSLRDLLIISTQPAELARWLTPSDEPRLMNVRTANGLSHTLYVTSVPVAGGLLLFGQADPQEQERLRRDFLELNQELTTLGRELALANAELVRMDGLKNQFLGMASHDLRKPVGLILNRAELLLEDAALSASPEACRQIRLIIASASSMARLINDFLDVSVIEAERLTLDIQVVGQDALVASAWALVREAAAERGITLTTLLDQALTRLRVDGPKLEQVLVNLFSNAVEHAPQGSCVAVLSRRQAKGIRFWVEDQGDGLAPEQQQRLFTPFTGDGHLKQNGEHSTGLGLAIVRKIVAAHGGSCFVESLPGAGSSFGFLLPASCLAQSRGVQPS